MASLRWREDRRRWQVRYRDPSGAQRTKSFERKSDARRYLVAVEADLDRGEWTDPRLGRISFGEFAAQWFETTVHLKPSTRASYGVLLRRYVLPEFGRFPLAGIERVAIMAWLAKLRAAGCGLGTVRNASRVLSRILAEAERSRLIPRNPAAHLPTPPARRQEMRFLTPDQIAALSEAVPSRHRALILMAAYTGLRWGELAALRPAHLDLLRGVVDVRESLSEVSGYLEVVAPKTGERRSVPLAKFLCAVLAEHMATYPSPFVFSGPQGGPLRRHNFYKRTFKPAVKAAGLDEAVRFHDLRHSAASIAIGMGANVKQVQQMLGHSSATVTLDTYSHIFPSLADQLREGLDSAYREAKTRRDVAPVWPGGPKEVVKLGDEETRNAR